MAKRRLSKRGVWSKREDALLRERFGMQHTAMLARKLLRTEASIRERAYVLFPLVTTPPKDGWTPARVERLRHTLGVLEPPFIARVLGVTEVMLREQTGRMHLAKRSRDWTSEEDELLTRLYGSRSDEDLSLVFTRPLRDIGLRAKELALSKDKAYRARLFGAFSTPMPRWSEADIKRLQVLYSTTPTASLARLFGRSVKSVAGMARRLHLRKTAARMSEMGRENVRLRRRGK